MEPLLSISTTHFFSSVVDSQRVASLGHYKEQDMEDLGRTDSFLAHPHTLAIKGVGGVATIVVGQSGRAG